MNGGFGRAGEAARGREGEITVPAALVRLDVFLRGLPPAARWGIVLATLAVVFAGDWLSGREVAWSIFYLLPVSLAAWHLGWRPALLVVLAGGAGLLLADRLWSDAADSTLTDYWNALVRTGLFLVVAYTLTLLRQTLEHERELARTDWLTGLPNSRSFLELGARELERARRTGTPLTLLYVDVDRFKHVNDTYGHAAGDELLREIAASLRSGVRDGDLVARLGGDEFVVLMPDAGPEAARATVERVRARLDQVRLGEIGAPVSIGVVSREAPPPELEELIRDADRAMYAAKGGGRRVVYRGSRAS